MSTLKGKKIVVTGGAGFFGQYVVKRLASEKVKDIIVPRSKDCDLRSWQNCLKVVNNTDIIIHMAGIVGGIGFNLRNPATMFEDNLLMGIQLMKAAREQEVEKFVTIGTICSYPKFCSVPFKEIDLWLGYPEETNAPYGLAKKILLVQGQAYREQYGFNTIYLLPVNLYGPGDNFDPERSHVIPALIRKVVAAKKNKLSSITVWGTGKATREFLYVEDAAEAIVLATQRYDSPGPVNIGSGMEIVIRDLVYLICKMLDYKGRVLWDKTKPDGQPRRRVDATKAFREFGFKAKTNFEEGLKKTIDWYRKTYVLR